MYFIPKALHRATDAPGQNGRRILLSVCAFLALTLPSHAGTVAPDPTVYGSVGGTIVSAVGGYSQGGASLSIFGLPSVVISADAVGAAINDHPVASGTYSYDILITGGTAGDVIPLLVSGVLTTNSLGLKSRDVTNATASLTLNFANGTSAAQADVACGNVLRHADCSNPTWSGTLSAVGWVGYDNFVTLSASAEVSGSGFANAYADPYVFIDPAFQALHPEYGLNISPLVGNQLTAAPEPATWFLSGGALVLAELLRRRART